jgi:transketolase
VSDLGDLEARVRACGWAVGRCDGNDVGSVSAALESLRAGAEGRPKLLVADTRKGAGVSFMEPGDLPQTGDALYPFHSGAPGQDEYERALRELTDRLAARLRELGAAPPELTTGERPRVDPPSAPQRLVDAYGEALAAVAEHEPRLLALDADLYLDTGLIPFRQRFPDRFVECGIAEQDMVSQAGTMALAGLLPIVHSFACFLSTRPNEQIYNNATEGTKIIYVGSLAGLLPAGPGHSHQAVRDIAAVGAVPDLILIEPCAEREAALALDWCVNEAPSSCYLRLVSIPADVPYRLPDDHRLVPGRGVRLRDGGDGVVVGYGPVLLAQACRAADAIAEREGLQLAVVNLPWLNRVDASWLAETVAGAQWLFTLDNHYLHGGQGQLILATLAEMGRPLPVAKRLGITRIPLGGGTTEILVAHGLDAESLAAQIRTVLLARAGQ